LGSINVNPAFPLFPGSPSALRYPAPSDQDKAAVALQHRLDKTTMAAHAQPASFIHDNKTDANPLSILDGA